MPENVQPPVTPPSIPNPPANGPGSTVSVGGQEMNAGTRINSVEDLRLKEPELYRLMMEGYALAIIREQNRSMRRIKEINRESKRQQNS